MMKFDPDSWSKAGADLSSTSSTFKSKAQAVMDQTSEVGRVECDKGMTLADGCLAGILPALNTALQEAITGMSDGLDGEGGSVVDTGTALAKLEQGNEDTARGARGA